MSSFERLSTVCVQTYLTIQLIFIDSMLMWNKLHSVKEGMHNLDHPDIILKEIKQMHWGQENTFY